KGLGRSVTRSKGKLRLLHGAHQMPYIPAKGLLRTILHVITDIGMTRMSSLRSHHDHTVPAGYTINGGCTRVFQHADAFDIVQVHRGHIAYLDTIHYIQWLVLTKVVDTTHIDRAGPARLTRGHHVYSGSLALKDLLRTGDRQLLRIADVHRGNRSRDILFLL